MTGLVAWSLHEWKECHRTERHKEMVFYLGSCVNQEAGPPQPLPMLESRSPAVRTARRQCVLLKPALHCLSLLPKPRQDIRPKLSSLGDESKCLSTPDRIPMAAIETIPPGLD